MGWKRRDLDPSVLGVLIMLLLMMIYESAGSTARSPIPSPSKPKVVSQPLQFPHGTGFIVSPASETSPPSSMKDTMASPSIPMDSRRNHDPSPVIVPTGLVAHLPLTPPPVHISPVSMSPSTSSQLPYDPRGITAPSIKVHNPRRERTPQPTQAPSVFDGAGNTVSPSHVNPPGTQIKDGGSIHGKPINDSPLVPQHAPGLNLPPIQTPLSSSIGEISVASLPAPTNPPGYFIWQIYSPKPSPTSTSRGESWAPSPQPKTALPPPPPNLDCGSMMCHPPLTNPSPGTSCACVLPIKIGLRLGIDLYTFFPLVSEFAKEIATGIFMKQNQVRVMGVNAATEDSAETDVLVDLVPLGKSFDNKTVFLTFEKFWQKKVLIQGSYFGDYGVLYVRYPGLPPSPPKPSYVDTEAFHSDNNARRIHPLGVDVKKYRKKHSKNLIPIVAILSALAFFSIIGAALLLILKSGKLSGVPAKNFESSQQPLRKSSGTVSVDVESGSGAASASFGSNIAAYTGSAKTFTVAEMERATSMFDDSRVIGEGGFGRVYQGTLEDGTMVAVKVLKRVDRQGESEFLAEVEMLSRLHHRNLVNLIGICAEENLCCIVYELIPNGSVESHLHDRGDKTTSSPLDWNSRVKIAVGTARALAYLHEDSNPPVIHRDLKSSNILLQHDFTPRVSDFGLARSALHQPNKDHISTRVMGTFGYVDPEYAMTGHLLIQSDVYSYGVVLVELLTGRKPVDMSQPPGQENLVSWTRHLLTNTEGLETIMDPVLAGNYDRDGAAKVAAIASICVQPEVSSRPLMSEVVQALKLDEMLVGRDGESVVEFGARKEELELDGSFRRNSSSGLLRSGGGRCFWRRMRGLGSGSWSDIGIFKLGFGLEGGRTGGGEMGLKSCVYSSSSSS